MIHVDLRLAQRVERVAALNQAEDARTHFSTATHPRFRRRGVQAALIRARLAHAQRAGCDLAVVTTSPGSDSQRNVQRYGFGIGYTRLTFTQDRDLFAHQGANANDSMTTSTF